LFALPAGRVAKWIVLAAWVVVAALVAPFAGQLQSVQENEAASFLPSSAESTRALELQRQLPGGDRLPVVVVYRRESGITPADRQLAAGHLRELAQGQEGPPPVPSEDGTALLLVVSLPAGDAEALITQVEDIRETVGRGDGDLEIRVTGPGGFLTDAVSVFEDIDTTLLLIAGQKLIEASYPSGTGQQTTIIAGAGQAEQVLAAAQGTEGVAEVVPAGRTTDLVQLQATLRAAPPTRRRSGPPSTGCATASPPSRAPTPWSAGRAPRTSTWPGPRPATATSSSPWSCWWCWSSWACCYGRWWRRWC
jgi:MMPL family